MRAKFLTDRQTLIVDVNATSVASLLRVIASHEMIHGEMVARIRRSRFNSPRPRQVVPLDSRQSIKLTFGVVRHQPPYGVLFHIIFRIKYVDNTC